MTDAHNHLQDARFAGRQADVMDAVRRAGVARMVVNGTGEEDWPGVAALARQFPEVVPAFGCHPWWLRHRTPSWIRTLESWLDATPGSGVGEIGLDRWMIENPEGWRRASGVFGEPPTLAEQESAFVAQLEIASRRNLPASIHCLGAFGPLGDLLGRHPRPERGFLLHSYGGPRDRIPGLVRLGAYFGFPGYFGHERKAAAREVFRHVPRDRLLVETDAPDQLPPEGWIRHPMDDPRTGRPVNHPANLGAAYEGLAAVLELDFDELVAITAANFERLFGRAFQPVGGNEPSSAMAQRRVGPGG
ncbi:MAG: TatD family hydrolase [Verrucomicrobiae bacterium]|nr:TatD family hydrolase [Verrucomicrobiae bacterium]